VAKKGAKSGGKKGKKQKELGPATVIKPALYGVVILTVIQTAMHVFLKV
jgi:hypothetical protein